MNGPVSWVTSIYGMIKDHPESGIHVVGTVCIWVQTSGDIGRPVTVKVHGLALRISNCIMLPAISTQTSASVHS